MTIDVDLTHAAKAAFDAAYPLSDRPSWQDPNVRQTWHEIASAALASASPSPSLPDEASARPSSTAPARITSDPAHRGPGRPPMKKEVYLPFSSKIALSLRERLDAEVARVKGTDQEVSIVTAIEEGLTAWLDAREP